MAQRVLLFPAGSEVLTEVWRALRYAKGVQLVGASSASDHAEYMLEDGSSEYVCGLPFVTDPAFDDAFVALVEELQIDAVFPGMDAVLVKLKELEPRLGGCKVLTSPIETVRTCLSKRATYAALAGTVRCPQEYTHIDEVTRWPVFLKPEVGYGSRGAALATTANQARAMLEQDPSLMILENLPGEEFTVDCFADRHGNNRFTLARTRSRIRMGISVRTQPAPPGVQRSCEAWATALANKLALRGMWFFQVKRATDGELALLEVAARCGGSSVLARNLGVNLPLLALWDARDVDVDVLPLTTVLPDLQVSVDRAFNVRVKTNLAYDTLYVDFDDCLVLRGDQLNPELVRLLAQCRNAEKRVVVLSRHAGDLEEALRRAGIRGLVDEAVHITDPEQPKSAWMHGAGVLIDDSHRERRDAMQAGFAAFDVDAVTALLHA